MNNRSTKSGIWPRKSPPCSPSNSIRSTSMKSNHQSPSASSSSTKRTHTAHSTPSNRPFKTNKTKLTTSPSSTITSSTASPGSSLSSPDTIQTLSSNRSNTKKTSAAISKLSLKSPPDTKFISGANNDNDSLRSLRGEDGKLHLCNANLTNKHHLWIFVKRKNTNLTSQDKECFLNAVDHDDCLQDLYAAYTPLELKMLYWQTCRNADIETNPSSFNWGRDQAGNAITKIVNEHWNQLSAHGQHNPYETPKRTKKQYEDQKTPVKVYNTHSKYSRALNNHAAYNNACDNEDEEYIPDTSSGNANDPEDLNIHEKLSEEEPFGGYECFGNRQSEEQLEDSNSHIGESYRHNENFHENFLHESHYHMNDDGSGNQNQGNIQDFTESRSEEVGEDNVEDPTEVVNNELQDDAVVDIYALETAESTKAIIKKFKEGSGMTLTITSSGIMRNQGLFFAAIFIGELSPCWYYMVDQFTSPLKTLYTENKMKIPHVIENMTEHKLRVPYSSVNEKKTRENATYPETRWLTVVPLNPVNPEAHLEMQLKTLTRLFKQALEPRPHITPGRRFMTFCENSGKDAVIRGCKYMGDLAAIERQTNTELIKLGKREHVYVKQCSLDAFLPDVEIKKILENYLNCHSWKDVPESVKKVCYRYYPARRNLPHWESMVN